MNKEQKNDEGKGIQATTEVRQVIKGSHQAPPLGYGCCFYLLACFTKAPLPVLVIKQGFI